MNKKQKTKHRYFRENWESDVFCIEQNHKPLCLICGKTFNCNLLGNLKRHFNFSHPNYLDESKELTPEMLKIAKNNRVLELKNILFQKNDDETFSNREYKLASYKVAYLIAKNQKYFSAGEFLKNCIAEICDCIFSNKPEIKKSFEKIPMSSSTITRRIKDISLNLQEALKSACKNFNFSRYVLMRQMIY